MAINEYVHFCSQFVKSCWRLALGSDMAEMLNPCTSFLELVNFGKAADEA
jgi:hypothetical protein